MKSELPQQLDKFLPAMKRYPNFVHTKSVEKFD